MLKLMIDECVAYANGWERFLAAAEAKGYPLSGDDKREFRLAKASLERMAKPGPAGLRGRSRWLDMPATAA